MRLASRFAVAVGPLLLGILGLLVAHHSMIVSALGQVQGDLWDSRFVNYMLEHSFLWLTGTPFHTRLWDPPFFYPQANTAAYSETFIGAAPAYWLWRALGFSLDTAYQLWILLISAINYVTAYLFLRRVARVSALPAAFGAFLFAYGAPRINQIPHPQLLPHFFSLLVVWALALLLRKQRHQGRGWALPLLLGSLVAQFYASVYLGWFLTLGLGVMLILAAVRPAWRRTAVTALAHLRPHPLALIISTAILALGGILAAHYVQAAASVGVRSFDEVRLMLPRWSSWIYLGPASWFYGDQSALFPFNDLPMEWEHRLGIGLLTTALAAWGFWIRRDRALVQVLALVSATLMLASFSGPGGLTIWRMVYEVVPGGSAIRAVSRIGVVALIPASVGLAFAMERLLKQRIVIALILATACILEQGVDTQSYSKTENSNTVAALAQRIAIDEDCEVFFYTRIGGPESHRQYQIDAMWASLATGTPTVNGYSGNMPPDWDLWEVNLHTEKLDYLTRQEFSRWLVKYGLEVETACMIQSGKRGSDDSAFTDQNVPRSMDVDRPNEASLVVLNTGSSTWTRAEGYRLGSQAPQDNNQWGVGRVELPVDSVPPGESVSFVFDVTPSAGRSPDGPGSRRFRWRMVRDGVHWFGAFSEPVLVELTPASGP